MGKMAECIVESCCRIYGSFIVSPELVTYINSNIALVKRVTAFRVVL